MAKSPPQRTCIVSGENLPREVLLRFVVGPDGSAVPDIKGNLPGRGIWLKPQRPVLEEAIRRNAFSRSAKKQVKVPSGLPDQVERLLLQRAMNYLKRAKQAGELVTGFEKVASSLQKGDVSLLIHATDAAADGCRKLDKLTHPPFSGSPDFPETTPPHQVKIVRFTDRDKLAEALNLANPVHIAIKSPDLSAFFLHSFERWAGFQQKDRL